jgi:hypothetical protein
MDLRWGERRIAPVDLSKRIGTVLTEGVLVLTALVLLVSCAGPTDPAVPSLESETDRATPTPPRTPYWDLQPLTAQPEGGWKTYRNEELGLAFEYPAVYDELDCGHLYLFEKVYKDTTLSSCPLPAVSGGPQGAECRYTVVGSRAIQVRVWDRWAGDLTERVAAIQGGPEIQELTAMEPFSIDGVPAFRRVYTAPQQADLVYVKDAFAVFDGRLYDFSYHRMLLSNMQCDAPPLSQEEVYEHLLATFEFTD